MKYRRRGAALLWAILVTLAVAVSVAVIGSSLRNRAQLVRSFERQARREEMFRAAAALAGSLQREDAAWHGSIGLDLGSDRLRVRRSPDETAFTLEVRCTGCPEWRRRPWSDPPRPRPGA